MTYSTKHSWTVGLSLVLLSLAGCRNTGLPEEQSGASIAFSCRATELRGGGVVTTDSFHDDMSVTAIVYPAGNPARRERYFVDEKVTKTAGGWITRYGWLGDASRYFDFYAHAPFGSLAFDPGAKTYELRDNDGQRDIVIAEVIGIPTDRATPVTLDFRHILSGVCFAVKQDSDPMEVETIALEGLHSSGIYRIGTTSWEQQSTPRSYTLPIGVAHPDGATEDTPLTETPFFVLPGTLPDGAVVKVRIKEEPRLFEIPLKGTTLTPGTLYVIRLCKEDKLPLAVEVVPWKHLVHKKGYLQTTDIQMLTAPQWGDNGTVLTDPESRAKLTFTFLRPIGVEWRVTITNGLDFALEGVREGITAEGRTFTVTVKPLKPQGAVERSTELYITMYGKEIDPDNYVDGNGPIGIGRGKRYKVVQKAK